MYKYSVKFGNHLNDFWNTFALCNILLLILHFHKHNLIYYQSKNVVSFNNFKLK